VNREKPVQIVLLRDSSERIPRGFGGPETSDQRGADSDSSCRQCCDGDVVAGYRQNVEKWREIQVEMGIVPKEENTEAKAVLEKY
jgi:hypothetical protein